MRARPGSAVVSPATSGSKAAMLFAVSAATNPAAASSICAAAAWTPRARRRKGTARSMSEAPMIPRSLRHADDDERRPVERMARGRLLHQLQARGAQRLRFGIRRVAAAPPVGVEGDHQIGGVGGGDLPRSEE